MAEQSSEHHQPHYDEQHATPGGLNVAAILMIGAVGVILIIVTTLAAQAWFYNLRQTRIVNRQWSEPDKELAAYERAQRQKLTETRWVDQEKGIAAIPIEKAMEITAEGGLESSE